jgi:hypothetical protein
LYDTHFILLDIKDNNATVKLIQQNRTTVLILTNGWDYVSPVFSTNQDALSLMEEGE